MPSRITRNISAGIAVMALAAPAAQARPITEQSSGDAPSAPETVPAESRPATTIVDEGFDWGSAAIGAGGAGALIVLSLAGGSHVAGIRTRLHRA